MRAVKRAYFSIKVKLVLWLPSLRSRKKTFYAVTWELVPYDFADPLGGHSGSGSPTPDSIRVSSRRRVRGVPSL